MKYKIKIIIQFIIKKITKYEKKMNQKLIIITMVQEI